jgi:hypothetical protein
MPADPFAALEALLDAVHAALLAGDLAALSPLAESLEAAAPPAGPPPAATAARLRAKAARNARCLEAAGRGLRAAGRRLAESRAAALGVVTYDGAGRRTLLPATAPGLARRL